MDVVTLTIDGVEVKVPKGANLIDAARLAGVEVPHYCYHPHLTVAGNCRMCQVQIEGQPKLTIACNTPAAEGMKVKTHRSSPEVAEAQRAILEFLLINHPLDCTVCDQAGHCKLQDYYYEYNTQASRFMEEKVRKVKAEVLGPEVIYDGERCILCTRCVRFCEEVTKTSELGVFNRGDRSVIGIVEGRELNNPLSGTVVDLCPVGALTHRRWRFNTRIWFTSEVNTICTGCSTGCNVKAAVRDGRVVQVKARQNSFVNKEWLCDEGRYGFERFPPRDRLTEARRREGAKFVPLGLEAALGECRAFAATGESAVFLSPFLTLEEVWVAALFLTKVTKTGEVAFQLRERALTPEQAVLLSPDYAPNARAAVLLGFVEGVGENWRMALEGRYGQLLDRVRRGEFRRILLVGDQAILDSDVDEELAHALERAELSVALTPRGAAFTGAHRHCRVLLPSRTVSEKSGVMVNAAGRLQRLNTLLTAPYGTLPEWLLLLRLGESCGVKLLDGEVADERALFRAFAAEQRGFSALTLARIGELGITLEELERREGRA